MHAAVVNSCEPYSAARAVRRRQRRRRSPAQHGDSARPAPPHLMARHRHCLWLTCAAKAWAMFFLLHSHPPKKQETPPAGTIKGWVYSKRGGGVGGWWWCRVFADSRNLEFTRRGQKKIPPIQISGLFPSLLEGYVMIRLPHLALARPERHLSEQTSYKRATGMILGCFGIPAGYIER